MADYTFTVFTATFNRAGSLQRAFSSLRGQTFRDFEWIVIDDGSTDGTGALVQGLTAEFPIRYERQERQGKHVAHNRAVSLARGELFIILDSDDELTPEALERFHRHWGGLSGEFLGVGCHCRDGLTGRVIGRPPAAPLQVDALEYVLRRRIDYDIAACVRTDLLRLFPFPAVPNVRFVPEAMVWNRLMRGRKILMTGEVLKTVHYGADGFTRNIRRSYREDAEGRYLYFLANLNERADLLLRCDRLRYLKDLVQLGRMMLHAGRGVRETARRLTGTRERGLFRAMLPAAYVLYRSDRAMA